MTIVDAGANIGIYSLFMAKLAGASGRIHSFEPAPDNFARLVAATRHWQNVFCIPAAVGESTRAMSLFLSPSLNVDHRTYETSGQHRSGVPIRCVALDDYFPPGSRVDLIKMDIQGYEFAALKGAARVLDENPSVTLLLEFWPHGLLASGAGPQQLLDFLQQRAFHVSKIGSGGSLLPLTENAFRCAEDIYCNLFARRS